MPRQNGFTLLELLIASFLMGLATFYLTQTFTMSQKAYVTIDQVTESQQNMRAIADLMQRDLRHAGFMVPPSAAVCGVDVLNGSDTLIVSDADVIDPEGTLGTKASAFADDNINGVDTPGNKATNTITVNLILDGDPSYDTDTNGVNDSDFRVDGGVIVVDRADAERGNACGIITDVDLAAGEITFDAVTDELEPTGGGTDLVAIPAHVYEINAQNQLLRDGMVLTQGVEDLQVAYFVDDDNDNTIDADEYMGDGIGPDFDPSTVNPEEVHEVRVSIVVRTRGADPTFTQGQFQATENRLAVPGNDGFRRRVHTLTTMLRNVVTRT